MPLGSGERTGVKQSLRPKAVAVSSVSLAMYAEPLSDNHSTGCAALLIPKSTLDADCHQVAHHLAGDAGGGGQPAHNLAIAGIDSKQHTRDLAITTGGLKVIGTPADVRAQCNHDAVMRAPSPAARILVWRQFVGLPDPQHTLAIDWRLSVGLSLPVYEAPDTPIPVGWALVHQPADQRQ